MQVSVGLAVLAIGCSAAEAPPEERTVPPSFVPLPPTDEGKVWKSTSRRIEIEGGSYDYGTFAYAKNRDELTAEQLDALEELRFIVPTRSEGVDGEAYRVRIHDADGTVASLRASSFDGYASREPETQKIAVEFASIERFVATLGHCLRGWTMPWQRRTSTIAAAPHEGSLVRAQQLSLDSGCDNSVYIPASCGEGVVGFVVPSAGTYEISAARCHGEMTMRAYAGRRTNFATVLTSVAESRPAESESCLTLRHRFEAGSYVLAISKTNPFGRCPADDRGFADGLAFGPTVLRVRQVAGSP